MTFNKPVEHAVFHSVPPPRYIAVSVDFVGPGSRRKFIKTADLLSAETTLLVETLSRISRVPLPLGSPLLLSTAPRRRKKKRISTERA